MKNNQSRFEILQEEIEKMYHLTSSRSKENKKKSFRIYISIAVSTAIVTILVAIGDDFTNNTTAIKILTLFFSALSTVLAAWDGFYNHKQLWVNYGESRDNLKELLLKVKLTSDEEKNNTEFLIKTHKEFQSIIDKGNYKWKELRLDENNG